MNTPHRFGFARRLGFLMFILVLVIIFAPSGHQPSHVHAQSDSPVNISAVVLGVDCNVADVSQVDFYYYQLDGSLAIRTATRENGSLTYTSSGIPIVVYEWLSFDFQRDSLYSFIGSSVTDIPFYSWDWYYDSGTNALYSGITCY